MAEGEGNQGEGNQGGWLDGLSEGVRTAPSIAKFKGQGIENLATSYLELEKTLGKDKIIMPGDGATEQDWNKVWDRLGRPEKPELYNLTSEAQLPEGVALPEERLKSFREFAYKNGLTGKQATAAYDWYLKDVVNDYAAGQKADNDKRDAAVTRLKIVWGDAYTEKRDNVVKMIKKFGGENAEDLAAKYGNDPYLLNAMATLASKLSEDVLGEAQLTGFQMTPAEAQAKIDAIMNDPKSAYYNDSDPKHAAVVDEVVKLRKSISASSAA